MKKSNIEKALYEAVMLIDCEGKKRTGYLVPNQHFKTKYTLLPLNDYNSSYTYCASHIKSIQYLRNGVILK